MFAVLSCLALLACGGSASRDAATTGDGATASDATPGVDAAPFDPGPAPTAPIVPVPGEVTILQMDLRGLTVLLGEAAVIVGPDGTLILLDIGNSNHDDDVRDLIRSLNTEHLTPANGFPARGALDVDWVIITHFHSDHLGAFDDLFVNTGEPVRVTRGVVHRGFVDLGPGMTESDYEVLCAAMRGPMAALDMPVCHAQTIAPCATADLIQPHPAAACPGLHLGDLSTSSDDDAGAPSFIPLGDGARIVLVAADGHVSSGATTVAAPVFGHDDNNQENARSLAGVIEYGAFRYHFGGDMTGSGDPGEPDIETHLVTVAGDAFYGARGVDVAHTHHHARRTSSNATLVNAMAPIDGRSRNAISGIHAGHIGSPHDEVMAAWADNDRLGDGRLWVTQTTATSGSHPALVDADGPVILQTAQAGRGYWVQAAGAQIMALPYRAVRDD